MQDGAGLIPVQAVEVGRPAAQQSAGIPKLVEGGRDKERRQTACHCEARLARRGAVARCEGMSLKVGAVGTTSGFHGVALPRPGLVQTLRRISVNLRKNVIIIDHQ